MLWSSDPVDYDIRSFNFRDDLTKFGNPTIILKSTGLIFTKFLDRSRDIAVITS